MRCKVFIKFLSYPRETFVCVTLTVFFSTSERIEEIKHIEKRRREQDDSEERKYSAEEKEVEEKRKSVRERTQDIEKRLSQTSMEEQLQRRDSQLLQGVSEGLGKLNVTQQRDAEGMFVCFSPSSSSQCSSNHVHPMLQFFWVFKRTGSYQIKSLLH